MGNFIDIEGHLYNKDHIMSIEIRKLISYAYMEILYCDFEVMLTLDSTFEKSSKECVLKSFVGCTKADLKKIEEPIRMLTEKHAEEKYGNVNKYVLEECQKLNKEAHRKAQEYVNALYKRLNEE